jgi:threonine aldolase
MFEGLDFCSDTVTKPSQEMKRAMINALLGDEQKGEDPTTKKLEELMAKKLGASAALFFPSATMCNQVAINHWCMAGDQVIGAKNCHIFNSETGGAAFHSRVQTRMIETEDGTFDAEQLYNNIPFNNWPYTAKTTLLLVENTVNAGGGTVWPKDRLRSITHAAKKLELKCHLDGARLFNAAVASSCDVEELAVGFDSITICFSKGLSCPAGAVLVFDEKHWQSFRKLKQVFGGSLRQSGILAAACLYALENNICQLKIDHENAKKLALGLDEILGIQVLTKNPQSNMVFFKVEEKMISSSQFLKRCIEAGVRFSQVGLNKFRAVTHANISSSNIAHALELIEKIMK